MPFIADAPCPYPKNFWLQEDVVGHPRTLRQLSSISGLSPTSLSRNQNLTPVIYSLREMSRRSSVSVIDCVSVRPSGRLISSFVTFIRRRTFPSGSVSNTTEIVPEIISAVSTLSSSKQTWICRTLCCYRDGGHRHRNRFPLRAFERWAIIDFPLLKAYAD